MIPSAKIAICDSAPPEKRFRKLKIPEPLSDEFALTAATLTPGT